MLTNALHNFTASLSSTQRRHTRVTPSRGNELKSLKLWLIITAMSILHLYWPVMQWVSNKYLESSLHWHWLVAAAISLLFCARINFKHIELGANNTASIVIIVCALAEIANQRTLQIQLLSAILLIVTLHAFVGHLVSKAYWRAMKWPVIVGVALLPLDFYLEPYFGYPLRLLTASAAQQFLFEFGFEALTSQSVLMVENRASVVDLDCSGINSLWAGAVFYLLLSWITRLSINRYWWMTGLLLVVLLLCANVVRIVALVVLDLNGLFGLSEIAHTALGAVGFVVSIFVIWKLSERLPKQLTPATVNECDPLDIKETSVKWPQLPVIAALLLASAVPAAEDNRPVAEPLIITLPAKLDSTSISLTVQEENFFNTFGAAATKYQLGSAIDNNSLVLVTSNWWKTQHKPDHCLQAMGFSIKHSSTLTLKTNDQAEPIKAVTVLKLTDADQNPFTAVYWFQTDGLITADHFRRMADTVRHPYRNWTMASLLLEGEPEPHKLLKQVLPTQQAIAISYKEKT